MRHLRNTLYIFTEDAYATLDGENIVVKQSGREMGRVPLHTLEAIFCFSYMGASPALMGTCAERGIGLSFFTPRVEGDSAATYFSALGELILRNQDEFAFSRRVRRPPTDPVNAMLSLFYTVLMMDCASALEGVGLDSYVGVLHTDRPGRRSLALDLMEELRPVMVDRFVLTAINNRMVSPEDFDVLESGEVRLGEDARKTLFASWQERKRNEIVHPYLKEKIPWGLVPHVQALLLARFIRGDLDGYPAFLWK